MQLDITYLEDAEIYDRVLREALPRCERSVLIATANLKDCRIEINGRFRSMVHVLESLVARGVEVRLLHAGVPSEAFLGSLRSGGLLREDRFHMRRCPRVHLKAVILDRKRMYFGSANLTGAGMGAKGKARRNFEMGFLTEHPFLIHQVQAKLERIWSGKECEVCGRRNVCPVPLEEPDL